MTAFIDVIPEDLKRFSEWHEEAGISRSMAYELLKMVKVTPVQRRIPGSKKPASFLTQEHLAQLAQPLELLNQGWTIPMLKEAKEKNDAAQAISDIVPTPSTDIVARPSQTPEPKREPLAIPRALAEAADLDVPLSNAEMAAVLGLSGTELDKSWDGDSPRPGFVLNRLEHRRRIFWTVKRNRTLSGGLSKQEINHPGARMLAAQLPTFNCHF